MGARLLKIFSLPYLIVLIGLAPLYFGQFDKFAADPGLGWHIETGRYVVENTSAPKSDPFLAPLSRPWVSDQWLSDLILYLGFQHGEWAALYNLVALVFIGTFFLIVLPQTFKSSGSWIAATVAAFFAYKISQIHFILRPVVFGFPFFAVTLFALLKWYRADLKSTPWYLVGVFVLWANIHPSFILGLLLIGIIATARLVDYILTETSKTLSLAGLLAAVKMPTVLLFVSALATLVNPYGMELHKSILLLGQSEFFMNLNEEWLSPNFKETSGKIFLLFLGSLVAPLLLGAKPKWRSGEFILGLTFLCFSLKAIRFFPYLGIVLAPLLADLLVGLASVGLIERYGSLILLRRGFSDLESRQSYSWLVTALILFGLFCGGISQNKVFFLDSELGPAKDVFPYQIMARLKEELSPNAELAVLASPDLGGFITLEGRGRIKSVIDDRNTLLGESFYREYLEASRDPSSLIQFARKVEADYFILAKNSPLLCGLEKAGAEKIIEDHNNILVKMRTLSE